MSLLQGHVAEHPVIKVPGRFHPEVTRNSKNDSTTQQQGSNKTTLTFGVGSLRIVVKSDQEEDTVLSGTNEDQ